MTVRRGMSLRMQNFNKNKTAAITMKKIPKGWGAEARGWGPEARGWGPEARRPGGGARRPGVGCVEIN